MNYTMIVFSITLKIYKNSDHIPIFIVKIDHILRGLELHFRGN